MSGYDWGTVFLRYTTLIVADYKQLWTVKQGNGLSVKVNPSSTRKPLGSRVSGFGSSIGRVAVSKTVGCGFESCLPCQKLDAMRLSSHCALQDNV